MCPSKVAEGATRGWIVPIGGAENKENDRRILRRFVEASGGEDADIVVIPDREQDARDRAALRSAVPRARCARVSVMDFDTRRDCQEAEPAGASRSRPPASSSPAATSCA
jgi:cyanophycinase